MGIPVTVRYLALMTLGALLAISMAGLGLETIWQNLMGGVLVLLGFAYMLGGAIYLWATQGKASIRKELGDRSLWLLAPGFLVVFFAPPLEYLYVPQIVPRGLAMQAIGLALILGGVLVRIWARSALKELYTGHLQVQANQRLIQSGPYRFVRHPGYAAFILLSLGLCVGYSSLIGLAAIPILMLPSLAYRMQVEEGLLIEQFGDKYRAYARTTKRIIPGLW